jgi:TRAP-type uncharacterized transport system substrate-binding protein
MAKQTNFSTSVDVRTVVEWTVDRAVYRTVYTAVYRTVRLAVYDAVASTVRDVVHQAKNKHPNHPGLQDFLREVGVRSDD